MYISTLPHKEYLNRWYSKDMCIKFVLQFLETILMFNSKEIYPYNKNTSLKKKAEI